MTNRRDAWFAISVAVLSIFSVTAAWRVHAINQIFGDQAVASNSVALAARLDALEKRLEAGEVTVLPSDQAKLVKCSVRTAAREAQQSGGFFREYAVLTRMLLHVTLGVFAVQMAMAISGFWRKPRGNADTP